MTTEADRVTAHTKVSDHVAAGLAALAGQFRGKPRTEGLLRAWLQQVQDVEDALWQLLGDTLATAEGVQLDQFGAIVGFPRGTLSDATYRAVLPAVVRARRSSGTPEDILEVVRLALRTTSVTYAEGAASITIEPQKPLEFDASALAAVLRIAKAAGVQLAVIDPPRPRASLFTFASDLFFPVTDAARGFGDVAGTTGGRLTGVV